MDSTAIEKELGLAIMKPAQLFCGFGICCPKEYRELEYGPGAMTRELILRVIEITSPQRGCMTTEEN